MKSEVYVAFSGGGSLESLNLKGFGGNVEFVISDTEVCHVC